MTRIVTGLILLAIAIHGHVATANVSNNTTGPITYVTYIEENMGFYKVADVTTHKDILYKERVLTINQGDTIMWLNDADVATITVVSEQDLWDKAESELEPPNRRFNHTFMISGTYTVYVDEYKNLVHQTIIVNPKEGYPTPTPSSTPSPTLSPTPVRTNTPVATPTPIHTTVTINVTSHTLDSNKTKNSSGDEKTDSDISWPIIIDGINAIANLIFSLSVMVIAYKIWKDY